MKEYVNSLSAVLFKVNQCVHQITMTPVLSKFTVILVSDYSIRNKFGAYSESTKFAAKLGVLDSHFIDVHLHIVQSTLLLLDQRPQFSYAVVILHPAV